MNEPVLVAKRMPSSRRVEIAKHYYTGHTHRRSKMHRAAIVANKDGRVLYDGGALSRR
jgi:hypothetical protein